MPRTPALPQKPASASLAYRVAVTAAVSLLALAFLGLESSPALGQPPKAAAKKKAAAAEPDPTPEPPAAEPPAAESAPAAKAAPPLIPSASAPIFTKPPTTPIEYWDAADYLIRTGQAPQAVPYLRRFLDSQPDDATLREIRDRYGAKSMLRLQDDPSTRPFVEKMITMLGEATRRHATKPERLSRFIGDLTKSREEQDYGVERLREAGPFAIPPLVQVLQQPTVEGNDRALIISNMGRLDRSAVPALVATLDSAATQPKLAADVAEVLGRIGDPRAIPSLTALAASPTAPSPAPAAARRAIESITGQPFSSQPKTPTRLLTDEARRYHTHAIKFPGDSVVLWDWDASARVPVPRTVSRTDAEGVLGQKLARAALAIDPSDRQAQVVALSLLLEKAIEREGFGNYPKADPSNTFSSAVAAGPGVLGDVLRQAIADGKPDLAAVAATALGKVTDATALAVDGQVNPLVEALSAPGRRTRLAAARALVALDPRRPFAGSSQVVPVLAQFVGSQGPPRAVVIDGNTNRGSQLAGHLKSLGYEPVLAPTGPEGFSTAAASADIELIFIDIHMIAGPWRLQDTLANLGADARTRGIPVYLVGPLSRETDLASIPRRFPGVKFIVTPTNPDILARQLAIAGRPAAPGAAERTASAREAAELLARIAGRPNSPFEADLARVEPALTAALNTPGTELPAAAAMGDLANPNAQRGLADVMLDPSKPTSLRQAAAVQLARNAQKFGPLVAADQEAKLVATFERETDPGLKTALGSVIGALRPRAATTGLRLQGLNPGPAAAPVPAPAPTSPEAGAPQPNPVPVSAPAADAGTASGPKM